MRSAQDILAELNAADESPRVEAKRSRDIGKSVIETVVAFANEPGLGGGHILLGVGSGVDDKGDARYWPEGLSDPDKIQKDLASQSATMLNVAIRPEMSVERIDGKTIVVVFVPEADVTQKPVYLKATGLPRGAFRRIGSTDQRCTDEDLWVLRGASQPQVGPDMAIVSDARMEDFDPQAIAEYRRLRAQANPQAEELGYENPDMLEALSAVRHVDGALKPTLAGIVLFGKPLALRRLFPALRIDYIRVIGTQWVDDPEQRFQSVDIRKALMLALPVAEASIVDEMPKGFRLPEGELQSRQEPILSRKVIREALANAVMHRSYQDHGAIQIIRYSNRIEILNPGYSLKDMASLGTPGSRLRNPAIAAVLHELNWAETKGSGIRTMRRMAGDAGLPLPEFVSDRQKNEFKVTLFLHHLLTEDDYAWLKALAGDTLSGDEAKALIYARETGAIDNTACRDFSGLDTLQASSLLRRLRDRGLLEKQGAGSRTHYTLTSPGAHVEHDTVQGELPLEGGKQGGEGGKQGAQGGKRTLPDLPPELTTRLPKPGQRLSTDALRQLIRDLCGWQALRGEELATLLHKDLKYLRNKHLTEMMQGGELAFLFPESPNHALQAYTLPASKGEGN
ncbi:MAG: ATP-dependent DNA helicase RecG [Rhodocyclales bacterium RIFCSPLOWO2_02_FULL_63_24]|nr:MAG: ATP-dependent DNA helicase RecG [Rhodocyclales bacterium GWA2_65_19]OHC69227.1 MAG: ATP-dependent DNA helicase RecG [Rhodocyclales bacterium RIFCSPLOWO2_02_FULL_63_24]